MRGRTALIICLWTLASPVSAESLAQPARLDLSGPRSWISNDNYPREAAKKREEGTVELRLDIGENGRIEHCEVTKSSGSPSLDEASCPMVRKGPRYLPARDEAGKKIRSIVTRKVAWKL